MATRYDSIMNLVPMALANELVTLFARQVKDSKGGDVYYGPKGTEMSGEDALVAWMDWLSEPVEEEGKRTFIFDDADPFRCADKTTCPSPKPLSLKEARNQDGLPVRVVFKALNVGRWAIYKNNDDGISASLYADGSKCALPFKSYGESWVVYSAGIE